MQKLIPVLTFGLVLALLAGGTVLAQSDTDMEKMERDLRRLKLENWLLKIMIKNPAYIGKVGLDPAKHKTLMGFDVGPLSDDERSSLGLGAKNGLKITAVTGEEAREAGIREGDVIIRFRSPFGRPVTARPDRFAVGFLPGDTAHLVLLREGKEVPVSVPVSCSCGAGDKCPFHSPLADMAGYLAKARKRATESSAMATLKIICTGQEQFRMSNCVDQNANGQGEYGLLGELGGSRDYRGSTENCKNAPFIPSRLGRVDAKGRARRNDYYVILYLPGKEKAMCDADARKGEGADLQEEVFVAYAFPVKAGQKGTRVFAIDALGIIMCLDNADGTWGGDRIPPPGLAFAKGKDPSDPGAQFVTGGQKGGASEPWYTAGSRRPSGTAAKEPKKSKKPEAPATGVLAVFQKAWRAAVDEYCKTWIAAEDRSGLDLRVFMDKHAQKAGFKDFNAMCVAAAKANPQAYSRMVKGLSDEMTERVKKMIEEETRRLKEKAKEEERKAKEKEKEREEGKGGEGK